MALKDLNEYLDEGDGDEDEGEDNLMALYDDLLV